FNSGQCYFKANFAQLITVDGHRALQDLLFMFVVTGDSLYQNWLLTAFIATVRDRAQ
ncbi:MAG: hypothetical protein ACI80S_001934, partial [Pseudohongiellaceae bacterium]